MEIKMKELKIENNVLIKCITDEEEVIIPDNIIELSPKAFENNKTIKKLIMNDNVKIIGQDCCRGCSNLIDIFVINLMKI